MAEFTNGVQPYAQLQTIFLFKRNELMIQRYFEFVYTTNLWIANIFKDIQI